ncbi:SRPBCC domain-containing protein [Prosthecochloris sp. N3]|uniref:SRPBCC domain-containing protein n=1 Tax=Prosthecochloris ethylica TaxID=2743976 RepID=A0ABR9XQU7_9CHLB|nr:MULTISPECIES: SRPBCC domain-containing protein [Prosthecochloris]MEC9487845.1 SRPBCC domain-containing protein [Prosthecochloris sp.]MBF0585432.1 SRPBCC domain-containing protein [Prosthecochloris ethylica]MBF0636218.1 SRPBCC domain-containing protein [Prosthecochloris ethylica]NUK46662.1 SRPBCC domain-containing protein [Prosthecochloris ethylica]RNA64736.1 SRPBCC domain-containing protein [Prosthecochloris sp. ZM_2]
MKEIRTGITIHAPRDRVWEVLTDFSRYGEWNPLIPSVTGELAVGNRLQIHIRFPLLPAMPLETVVASLVPEEQFSWRGRLVSGQVAEGVHFFELRPESDNETTFVNRELFGGVATATMIWPLQQALAEGYRRMNRALKEYIESGSCFL